MNKKLPLYLAVGAGAAVGTWLVQQQRAENARRWQQQVRHGMGTAFITGASSGIGAAFAWELARQGYDLVLLARREDRLQSLAEGIQHAHAVRVETFCGDLSDSADIERAARRIEQTAELSLLVNNAGFGTGGMFANLPVGPEMDMIRVHVLASVRLTRAALPGMLQRQHGGIINVSSLAGLVPMPGSTTYGSTKAYLIFFSKGLAAELVNSGVRIQALCPGFTHSEFHKAMQVATNNIPAPMWMTAQAVVDESLRGLQERRVVVIPGRINRLMAWFAANPLAAEVVRLVQSLPVVRQWQGVD